MEVAADRDRIAGLPHRADPLAGVDPLASTGQRRAGHVGVEVAPVLALPVDQQVVAIEDRVIAAAQDRAAADRDQGRATGGDYVEALVGATAAAGRAEFADVAAGPMRALDGEDVIVVAKAAVRRGNLCGGRCREGRG